MFKSFVKKTTLVFALIGLSACSANQVKPEMLHKTKNLLIAGKLNDVVSYDEAEIKNETTDWQSTDFALKKAQRLLKDAAFKTTTYDLADSDIVIDDTEQWTTDAILAIAQKMQSNPSAKGMDAMLLILPTQSSVGGLGADGGTGAVTGIAAAGGGFLGGFIGSIAVGVIHEALREVYTGYAINDAEFQITKDSSCTTGLEVVWVNLPVVGAKDITTANASQTPSVEPIRFPAETNIKSAKLSEHSDSDKRLVRNVCQTAVTQKLSTSLRTISLIP